MSENEAYEINDEEEEVSSYSADVEDQVVMTEDEREDEEDEIPVDEMTVPEYEKYIDEEIKEIMTEEEFVDMGDEDEVESVAIITEDDYKERFEEELIAGTEFVDEYQSYITEEEDIISTEYEDEIPIEDEIPAADEIPPEDEIPIADEISQEDEIPLEDEIPPGDEIPIEDEEVPGEGESRKGGVNAKKIFARLKFQYITIIREYGKSQKFAEKISEEDIKKIFEKFLKKQKKKLPADYVDIGRTDTEENLLFKVKRHKECYAIIDHFECKPGSKPFVKLELKEDKSSLPSDNQVNEINERRHQFQEFLNWSYKKYGKKYESPEKKRNTTHELVGEELRQHQMKFNLKNYNRIKGDLTLLPEVNNQVFLFSPHRDGTPEECLEVFSSGSMYIGTANVLGLNGHGTYVFPNGAVYVGHFKDNMFHGFGRILYPNKTTVEGIWYQGELMKPTLTFADGLEYDPVKWEYLESHDRRFTSEKRRGMLPDNDPQLSNEHPARAMPPGCYDTGEGFYNVKTKCLYHPITGNFMRIPSKQEAEWIMKNCRSNIDENVPFSTEYLPAQFDSQLNRNELVVDRNWYKTNFPEHSAEIGEHIRSEIIEDLFGNNYLTLDQMSHLSVPVLRTEEREIREKWTCVPKRRYINHHYIRCLPASVIKLLFTKSGDPCRSESSDSTEEEEEEEEINEDETINDNKFRLKKFIRTLQTINDFIRGKDIEWNDEMEKNIKDCIKVLQIFDDAFVKRSIKFKKVFRKTDKRFLKNVLALWLKYGGKPSDMKQFKQLVEDIRRYKKRKRIRRLVEDDEESTDSIISVGSLYRIRSALSFNWTRYQPARTRKKMQAFTRLVSTDAKKRS